MAYLVLARKYRPQRFGEMAGQAHVVRTLANALARGQLAHAFLFTGPRGVGKTTAARLVAKAVNCEKGPTAEPCGVCTPCVEIAEGRAVDVVEIDAASNNGVDNVREIVEAVKYRPARDRFKVFVVDEVHMLSTGAFNALLKTLEEPPEHVKFVLATTDVHKVPETIVSRCQRFDFRRLTQQQIVEQLGKVADAEALRLSSSSLALVARAAEGGMRDALSLLDQVRSACGDAPEDEAVAEALGAVDAASIGRVAWGLVRRDGAAILQELAALYERGQEMKRVAEELVRHLRNVTVAKLVPSAPLDLPDAELREVRAQAEAGTAPQLARVFDLAQAAVTEVKEAEQPRYALEVALLKACFLAPGQDLADLAARLEQLAGGAVPAPVRNAAPPSAPPPARAVAPAAPAAPAARPPPPSGFEPIEGARSQTGNATGTSADPGAPVPAATSGAAPFAARTVPAPEVGAPPADPAERWRAAVAAVEAGSPTTGGALRQASLVSMDAGEISVRIAPGLHAAKLQGAKTEIEAAFARHLGRPVRLAVTVGGNAQQAGAEPTPAGQSLAQLERAERDARGRQVREAARAHPNIQGAAQILGGEIDRTDEL
jgi:DNA polymerase-3 subunit gamma/tau